jgi:asparagine synthetase B (glutamine-hydrolysing)
MRGIGGFLLDQAMSPCNELDLAYGDDRDVRHRAPMTKAFGPTAGWVSSHARLSIIDLSPAGHQPMACAEESV